MNLYVASSMTDIPVMEIGKKAIPFIIAFIIALITIAFVPQLSLAII
jgi:C4-dicarboxylate transporter DctM subunit